MQNEKKQIEDATPFDAKAWLLSKGISSNTYLQDNHKNLYKIQELMAEFANDYVSQLILSYIEIKKNDKIQK